MAHTQFFPQVVYFQIGIAQVLLYYSDQVKKELIVFIFNNNFFGLTGYGVANAYWHGGKTDQDKPGGLLFRRYDSPENSFLDFARLIATVYKQAAAVSHYPRAYAREIAYSRYISEVNGDNRAAYCKMLESIAQSLVPIVYNLNNENV